MIERCPKGHTNIDIVNLSSGRWYLFCYDCNKKYLREDLKKEADK